MTFERGTLKNKVIKQSGIATKKGILVPAKIEQEYIVTQSGIPFSVRIAPNLARKDKARKAQDDKKLQMGREANPFLPYNKDLFVSDLSATHLCLINRFTLFEYPLLIVTREFEEQESVLTYEDFYSIGRCLVEMDGLAFYNGGLKAGATQPHKHFHFIPYPLGQSFTTVPIDKIIQAVIGKDEIFSLEVLPYQHLISRLDWSKGDSPEATAKMLESKYKTLMQSMAKINFNRKYSYNLIVTQNWMKIALRSAPSYVAISLNSLGFAGIFNVRSEFQVNQIKDLTPLTILQGVGVAKR